MYLQKSRKKLVLPAFFNSACYARHSPFWLNRFRGYWEIWEKYERSKENKTLYRQCRKAIVCMHHHHTLQKTTYQLDNLNTYPKIIQLSGNDGNIYFVVLRCNGMINYLRLYHDGVEITICFPFQFSCLCIIYSFRISSLFLISKPR